ncbi:MAG TPA: DUF3089 domain-containing protein [Gaiellaceae bacterium]|nr:DUF3089 domain-containing protein [Gaiellaceae bacterium]
MALALAGCGSAKHTAATTTDGGLPLDRWGTTWLCRPGMADDPCSAPSASTAVARDGSKTKEPAPAERDPKVDCFYVYPTVSDESSINADLSLGTPQAEVAIAQASRFSQACRMYAPVYRQITLSALHHPARITLADALTAYNSVRAAFRTYLTHYNAGRGIVFIGHSQGASILIKLLKDQVDNNQTLRRKLVSAILLGGDVTVEKGRSVGGDFKHLPLCHSAAQTECVVAYSSFASKPQKNSQFARTTSDSGVALLAPHMLQPNIAIACVNPAALAGDKPFLDPYVPSIFLQFLGAGVAPQVSTPWVSFPGEYAAACKTSGNATWLQIRRTPGSRDQRPPLAELSDPTSGLHILDVNIALGNLVSLVRDEAAAYRG